MAVLSLGYSILVGAAVQFTHLNTTRDRTDSQIRWGDVAIDGSNRAHLIWVSPQPSKRRPGKSDHHLFYRVASLDHNLLSEVVDLTRDNYRIDGLPAIACNDSGRTAIVAYAFDHAGNVNGSYLWTIEPGMLAPEDPIRLGADDKVRGRCGLADVAVAEDGRIIVAYATPNLPDSSERQSTTVWYELLDPQGSQITPPTEVGSGRYRYSRAANPRIAVNAGGKFAIAWNASLDEHEDFFPEQVFVRIFDHEGAPASEEMLVSCEGAEGTCRGDTAIFRGGPAGKQPAVAISKDGVVAVAFRNTRFVECSNEYFVLRMFDKDGSPVYPLQKINDVTECGASSFPAALAFVSDGRLLAAWANNNVGGEGAQSCNAYYQLFDKTGQRLGSNERISASDSISNDGCDWRVACDINRNGHVAISTVCNFEGAAGRQLLIHFTTITSLEQH